MGELNKAQKARASIRWFKIMANALVLRGYYKPGGESGKTLIAALRTISPEIYGTMNDPHRIELDGLLYVIDRLPQGIEQCSRITLSTVEGLSGGFTELVPLKRRRTSYRVSETEMCFEITRGRSEIYDLLTHLTFLFIEGRKIKDRGHLSNGPTNEWRQLETVVKNQRLVQSLDQELWNLSKILGRTFRETQIAYEKLKANKEYNSGLFSIVYWLGKKLYEAEYNSSDEHIILFNSSLGIDRHLFAEQWAGDIAEHLRQRGLQNRELHIISANMHSIINLLYGHAVVNNPEIDIFTMAGSLRARGDKVKKISQRYGCFYLEDRSGTHIDCQIIDVASLNFKKLHPELLFDTKAVKKRKPVIVVMDYAFGEQAFVVMDELLKALNKWNIQSISIMGKAGILEGTKGDIMLPVAHIFEGVTDTYLCQNQLMPEDFESTSVSRGSMVTVLGTSLQNKDILKYFLRSTWQAIGLEMEGGHYQKAIQSAMVRGHISQDVILRYAYYASDNPLHSGQTLASGGMGDEGIKPTYLITKIILEKILGII